MAIQFEDVNEGLRRIVLSGRLDTAGSEQIAPQFAELTESAKGGVVVYLSAVKFLSSMAIRVLVTGAKAVQAKGGRWCCTSPRTKYSSGRLEATGIDD
jgi:anti-anti-sigma factor